MDWQERLITLYVYLNKHFDEVLWSYCQRFSPNATPQLTDSEVVTIYLWGIMSKHQQIRT